MPYGVTPTGFVLKPFTQIRADISTRLKAKLGANFGSDSDTTVEGIMVGAVAAEISDAWLAEQAVYASHFPNSASGVSLESIGLYTGAQKLPATKSTVTLTLGGTNGTVVGVGFTAQVPGTTIRFAATAGGTISGGTLALPAEATVFGPVTAVAGTLTQIFTAVAGVTTVTNALDAVPGQLLETDAAFRVRRLLLLRSTGDATADAIFSDVLQVPGVTEVKVYNNSTNATVDTVPANQFEVVVLGGVDQDIINAIGRSAPAGISSFGSTTGTYVDTQGISVTHKFTRPTAVPIYVAADITTNAAYPVGGDALVKSAIVNYWTALTGKIARPVITEALKPSVFTVPGVSDIVTFFIGIAPAPVSAANIVTGNRQYATFDTSRVTVT